MASRQSALFGSPAASTRVQRVVGKSLRPTCVNMVVHRDRASWDYLAHHAIRKTGGKVRGIRRYSDLPRPGWLGEHYRCGAVSTSGPRGFSPTPCRYAARSAISEPLNRGQEILFSRMRFNITGPCLQRAATIPKDVILPAIDARPGAPLDGSS